MVDVLSGDTLDNTFHVLHNEFVTQSHHLLVTKDNDDTFSVAKAEDQVVNLDLPQHRCKELALFVAGNHFFHLVCPPL